jgi:hypothetical protein
MKNLKKGRRQEDFTKKYPVSNILESAQTQSIRELSKMYKLSPTVIHKIIHRNGSEDLKLKFKKNDPQTAQKEMKEAVKNATAHLLGDENNAFLDLTDSGLRISEMYAQLKKDEIDIRTQWEYQSKSINEVIRLVNSDSKLEEKNKNQLFELLSSYKKEHSDTYKLLLEFMKFELVAIEKFTKLEYVINELKSVKTLIDIFFDSFNQISYKEYKKIRNYMLEVAPITAKWFEQYESTVKEYIDSLMKQQLNEEELIQQPN